MSCRGTGLKNLYPGSMQLILGFEARMMETTWSTDFGPW